MLYFCIIDEKKIYWDVSLKFEYGKGSQELHVSPKSELVIEPIYE